MVVYTLNTRHVYLNASVDLHKPFFFYVLNSSRNVHAVMIFSPFALFGLIILNTAIQKSMLNIICMFYLSLQFLFKTSFILISIQQVMSNVGTEMQYVLE
jgi:hypothetical protein